MAYEGERGKGRGERGKGKGKREKHKESFLCGSASLRENFF
jgi:hypothetical protein